MSCAARYNVLAYDLAGVVKSICASSACGDLNPAKFSMIEQKRDRLRIAGRIAYNLPGIVDSGRA